MSRPRTITDEEILAAARAVFLDGGITATVDDVAARCHVGEATVFRRFPTKKALLVAAMDTAGEPEWLHCLEDRARHHDIRVALTVLAHDILRFLRQINPVFFLKMSNPIGDQRGSMPWPSSRAIRSLTGFFAIEIGAGRVRARDPRVAARIWIAALQHFVMFETGGKSADRLPADVLVRGLVDMFVAPRRKRRKG